LLSIASAAARFNVTTIGSGAFFRQKMTSPSYGLAANVANGPPGNVSDGSGNRRGFMS
jgi:hypothetical protein